MHSQNLPLETIAGPNSTRQNYLYSKDLEVRYLNPQGAGRFIESPTLELVALSLRTPSILLFPIGIVPSMLYTFSTASRKSALLTDILSMSFSYNALSMLKIDSFKTGCILLSGLFLYDIWWVFGTDVVSAISFKT